MKKAFWVEFINDRSVLVKEDQTILEASLAAGIPHYHACGGKGKCTTCRVLVNKGEEFLSPYSERELALRTMAPVPPNLRLACQTYVKGKSVHLHRMIRDETDLDIYIRKGTVADLQNAGDEQNLVLFFLDIRNFTPFMESYLPFDVIHVMRRLFSIFKTSIETYNGKIIETEGDGFYAVFGFDEELELASNNAYQAGLTILEELEKFNEQYLEKHFFHSFEVGIGLHAGRVIVGDIGIGVNNNLTAMGMPVNIASRIQAATRVLNNSFLISDDVFKNIYQAEETRQINISLKGVKSSITVHLCGKPYKDVLLRTSADDNIRVTQIEN